MAWYHQTKSQSDHRGMLLEVPFQYIFFFVIKNLRWYVAELIDHRYARYASFSVNLIQSSLPGRLSRWAFVSSHQSLMYQTITVGQPSKVVEFWIFRIVSSWIKLLVNEVASYQTPERICPCSSALVRTVWSFGDASRSCHALKVWQRQLSVDVSCVSPYEAFEISWTVSFFERPGTPNVKSWKTSRLQRVFSLTENRIRSVVQARWVFRRSSPIALSTTQEGILIETIGVSWSICKDPEPSVSSMTTWAYTSATVNL